MMDTSKTLVKLHRTLWSRTFKENTAQWMMVVLFVIYGLIGLANTGLMAGLDLSEGTRNAHALTTVNLIGVAIYLMLAMIMPAGEKQLYPDTLKGLPLSLEEVRPAMLHISFLNSRVWLSAGFSIIWAIVGAIMLVSIGDFNVIAVPAFVLGMALSWFITICLSECLMSIASNVVSLESDRSKFIGGILGTVLMLCVILLNGQIEDAVPLGTIGKYAAWTPFTAATGWATALGNGSYMEALAQLLIAIVTAVGLFAVWRHLIKTEFAQSQQHARPAPATKTKQHGVSRLRLMGLAYRSPAMMEYSRSLLYIVRDMRLVNTLIFLPVLAGFCLYHIFNGNLAAGLGVLVMLGLVGGLLGVNDYGYDGPSGWLKMMAPCAPSKFLLARHRAHLTPSAVVILICVILALIISPERLKVLAFGCAALGMLLSVSACSLALSVYNPYPVSAPGTNAWTDKSGYSAPAFVASLFGLIFGWIAVAPGLVCLGIAVTQDKAPLLAVGVILSLAVPAIVHALVAYIAGKRVNARMPEIYAKVDTWVS